MESGYYPPGAEFDPRAPYNEPPSCEDVYCDEALSVINDTIAAKDEEYLEWIAESRYMPEDPSYDVDKVIDRLAEYEVVQEEYTNAVFHDVCERLSEDRADYEDAMYDAYCDARYEEMREREYEGID